MNRDSRDGWTRFDRAAGVVALLLATGYVLDPVQSVAVDALSVVLEPLAIAVPFSVFVLLLAGTNGLFAAVVRTWLRNDERVRELKERMESLREALGEYDGAAAESGDDLAPERQELTRTWVAMMEQTLRPMVWSMLVTIPTFLWLKWVFLAPAAGLAPAAAVIPVLGQISWNATVLGPVKFWLAWYVGGSLSTGFVARRVVGRIAESG